MTGWEEREDLPSDLFTKYTFQVGRDFSIVYTVEVGSLSYLDPWDWIGVYEDDFLSLEDYVSFTWASLCRLTAQEKEVRKAQVIIVCFRDFTKF